MTCRLTAVVLDKQEIELCVWHHDVEEVATHLTEMGWFIPISRHQESPQDIDTRGRNYKAYKAGFPRLRAASWIDNDGSHHQGVSSSSSSSQKQQPTVVVIFPASYFTLDNFLQDTARPPKQGVPHMLSPEVEDLRGDVLHTLPIPTLRSLMVGWFKVRLLTHDPRAEMAIKELVDGVGLDDSWVESRLGHRIAKIGEKAFALVILLGTANLGKKERLREGQESWHTRFVLSQREARSVRLIPGV